MTPAARVQAAIDLLDRIAEAARAGGAAADTIIARYFATRRYAGSKDRRAVRELVYAAVRLVAEAPTSGRAAMTALAEVQPKLTAWFDGSAHGPAPITADEARAPVGLAPAWLRQALTGSGIGGDEQQALIARAPLDIRVNALRTTPEAVRESVPQAVPLTGLPDGLRLPAGADVSRLTGLAEVQDAGSQIVSLAANVAPGDRVIDLCAGAGGKTLALAALMRNEGTILATDTDRARLSRLAPRARAAGATIVETRLLDPGREGQRLADWTGTADIVLIDAPCSGTGTWRRNPEARWRLTPERLKRFAAVQREVLSIGAPLVRPGGALVYIVCSLLEEEGAGQVDRFLTGHEGWAAAPLALPRGRTHGPGVRLTPGHDDTDGFFVARLMAPC